MTGDDKEEITRLKKLALELEIKDLGKLHTSWESRLLKSKRGIFISQRKYILDLRNWHDRLQTNRIIHWK